MKPEAQRIAIAEACGWTFIEKLAFTGIPKGSRGNADARVIPDYINDLNAMHEAEKVLTQNQYWEYADLNLKATVWQDGPPGHAYQCATAAQRAEAFLKTLSLWRD